jgi:hypothetical protein
MLPRGKAAGKHITRVLQKRAFRNLSVLPLSVYF